MPSTVAPLSHGRPAALCLCTAEAEGSSRTGFVTAPESGLLEGYAAVKR